MPIASREATATVRGYIYQFDATIAAILQLQNGASIMVEGIEDFDVRNHDLTACYQCKYFASTKLTPSVLRDTILPMLRAYLATDAETCTSRRHHLYGHFKETPQCDRPLTLEELKSALVQYSMKKLPSGQTERVLIDLQKELGATDIELELFAESLDIHICAEYEEHKKMVIRTLAEKISTTVTEAEEFLYPTGLTLISRLASNSNPAEREITFPQFKAKVLPSHALHNAWLMREKGSAAYCKHLRQKHFSAQNPDCIQRFFAIHIPDETSDSEIESLMHRLRTKWSSHASRRKPNNERYAPYVHLHGLASLRLIALKRKLQQQGIRFVDGYAFKGAQFSIDQLRSQQTHENQLSLRIINSELELRNSLIAIHERKIVYEFFASEAVLTDVDSEYAGLPITSVPMISEII